MEADADAPSASAAAPDSRASLQHILAGEPAESPAMEDAKATMSSPANTPGPDDDDAGQGDSEEATKSSKANYASNSTTMRRNANGSVSSVYSGNKIRHLKKDDGIPLWRKDIQYDFLSYVFHDTTKVFTSGDRETGITTGNTFADIYLDAMAKSSKCSKILKDKLLSERPAAINMAMVCLLVNVGRMNTTLNFFPEMRAQLRTYHSIPCLQAHQDPNAYKQLQDAPRLKSILKGATEDVEQPSTIEDIREKQVPRTNPVNLIFVLAQYAPKVSELHFHPPRDFFDLVMRSNLSSKSRATAFLWLMWWYLESDFSAEAALKNPFGPGRYGPPEDTASKGMPIKCPAFEHLVPLAEALENVDTADEKLFGEIKRKERLAILMSDTAPVVTGPKRPNKKAFNQNPVFSVLADDGASTPGRERQSPSHGSGRGRSKLSKAIIERDYGSDTDRTRSASPPNSIDGTTTKKATPNMRINTLLNEDAPVSTPAPKGPGRGNWSRNRPSGARVFKAKLDRAASQDSHSPSANAATFAGPHGFYLPLNGADPSHKRTRPLTQHQLAVEQYRRRRVDVILDRGLRNEYKAAAKRRRARSSFLRAWIRCKGMQDGYDTDEEANTQAAAAPPIAQQQDPEVAGSTNGRAPPFPAGLVPIDFGGEVDDKGEEAYFRAKMLTRALRRMERWDENRAVSRSRPKGSRRSLENGHAGSDTKQRNGGDANSDERLAAEELDREDDLVDGNDDEDGDEEMQDADETMLERSRFVDDDESEDEDAPERDQDQEREEEVDGDGEADREKGRMRVVYDAHTLPPLPSHMG